MTKTEKELKELKEDCITLTKKLRELTKEELQEVTGGVVWLYEKSVDDFTMSQSGSRQEVIGNWEIEEHSK